MVTKTFAIRKLTIYFYLSAVSVVATRRGYANIYPTFADLVTLGPAGAMELHIGLEEDIVSVNVFICLRERPSVQ